MTREQMTPAERQRQKSQSLDWLFALKGADHPQPSNTSFRRFNAFFSSWRTRSAETE